MDGWVIVGTKLDSKQLEKDLKNAERRLQQYEKEAEKLTKAKAKVEIDLQPYEEQKKLIQQITDEVLQNVQTEQEVTRQLEIEKTQLEELDAKYSKQLNNLDDINKKIQENAKNQALVTNEIEETNGKLQQAKGISGIKDVIENINKSTSNVIKKVGKWALAVFGIHGAYMAVRNAINVISQNDEQLASDIEYMKTALAYTIEPLVRRIVNLMKQLMSYVGYIVYNWTNGKVNIFESANKSLNSANKNAQKLSKTLAGFDEMNVLNDNGTTGAMGDLPSVDLSAPEDVPVPSWIQWIADNKDLLISALSGIALGLLSIKFGLDVISGTGIMIFFAGLIYTIMQLVEYFSNLDSSLENNGNSFEKFGEIVKGAGIALAGLALAINSIPLAIVSASIIIIGTLVKLWDDIKLGFQNLLNWIKTDFMEWLEENFGILGLTLGGFFQGIVEMILHSLDGLFGGFKQIFDGILLIAKGNFKQGFINIIKGLVNSVTGILNGLISGANAIISPLRALIVTVGKIVGKSWTMDNIKIPIIPRLAVGGIVNMPGRGVNYMGANIAERGPEGVIPLTNSQMMSELGKAIGQYVTINANITNTMNGRVISRELQKINTNSDFAFNR